MPGLTVTEKEHWKDRIGQRIERRIEGLAASEPNLFDRVQREARALALRSLNLADAYVQYEAIEHEKEEADRRQKHVCRQMLAVVRGVPVEEIDDHYGYRIHPEVERAVGRRQEVFGDEQLAESEVGQKILRLREERDHLLDTVWLATSPAAIRMLWTKVGELLGDESTQLQRDALAIPPESSET